MKYNLFNINKYDIDCSNFNHLLCDDVNAELEEKFAKYVGAKYACVANSASSLLFVCLDITKRMLTRYSSDKKEAIRMNPVFLPSIIPPAVANVVHNSGMMGIWTDNVDWVGSSYVLYDFAKSVCSKNSIEINANFESKGYKIIDSAQEVRRNQFEEDSCSQGDLMVFSFYPTKPVGGIDGGIVVSNDEVLAIVSLYWFSESITSSTRLYKENGDLGFSFENIKQPMAGAVFERDLIAPPRAWAEEIYNVVQWNTHKGGHFAALEQPESLSADIIDFIKKLNIV